MPWLPDNVISHLRSVADLPDLSQTKYRDIEKISAGGMGTVFRATDPSLRRQVALKVLNIADHDGDLVNRMLQEAYIIAALEHPGIVPIHDVGTLPDGRVYYVMKLVRGMRLDDKVKTGTDLPELLRIFQRVCEAVAFAHDKGIIHRDLKPENIMVGGFGEVLVMDWGLSKVLDRAEVSVAAADKLLKNDGPGMKQPQAAANATEHGTVMGTPAYMAPEQASGDIDSIDARTDVYALGAILRFFLSSRAGKGRRKKEVPRQLQAIIEKSMSEDMQERYANAMELVSEVDRYLTGDRVSAYRENLAETLWRLAKQHKFIIFLILVYIIAKLLVVYLGNL